MPEESPIFDLSRMDFDQFVTFFFQHDIATEEHWAFDLACSFDLYKPPEKPAVIVKHMTRLFRQFGKIGPNYSLQQLNVGIWPMLWEPFALRRYLWDRAVPLADRLACVRSMSVVFADFVAKSDAEVMENCFYMWWDAIAKGFWQDLQFESGSGDTDARKLDPDSRSLLDAMFDMLKRIIEVDDLRTQGYALHGLGHLHHPGVHELVQAYIERHQDGATADELRWLEQCRDGTVM
jgi:hypothetical protein